MWTGKVVWISGASSGIGESIVYKLAARGARIVISSNEAERLEEVRKACPDPDNIKTLWLDLADLDSLSGKAQEAMAAFGPIDYLFNNGGITQRSLVKDTSLAAYRRVIDIDLLSHIEITRAVLPSMLERKSGHIIVTSSVAGKVGAPLRAGYCAAKHGLHGFFDTLRAETWRENIKVTIVCPTAVTTNISMNALTGSGAAYGKMSDHLAAGHTADHAADIIIRAVEKGREEVIAGTDKLMLAVYLKRFVPGIFSRLLNKAEVN